MPYAVTYETADGTVEEFATFSTKKDAEWSMRTGARESAMNSAFGVTRWFVERDGMTIAQKAVK